MMGPPSDILEFLRLKRTHPMRIKILLMFLLVSVAQTQTHENNTPPADRSAAATLRRNGG